MEIGASASLVEAFDKRVGIRACVRAETGILRHEREREAVGGEDAVQEGLHAGGIDFKLSGCEASEGEEYKGGDRSEHLALR